MKIRRGYVLVKSDYLEEVGGFKVDSSYHVEKSTGVIVSLVDYGNVVVDGLSTIGCNCFGIARSIEEDYYRLQYTVLNHVIRHTDYDEDIFFELVNEVPKYSVENYMKVLKEMKLIVRWTSIDIALNDGLMVGEDYLIDFSDVIGVLVEDELVAINGNTIFVMEKERLYKRDDSAERSVNTIGEVVSSSRVDYYVDGEGRESILEIKDGDRFVFSTGKSFCISPEPYILLDREYYYILTKDIKGLF